MINERNRKITESTASLLCGLLRKREKGKRKKERKKEK